MIKVLVGIPLTGTLSELSVKEAVILDILEAPGIQGNRVCFALRNTGENFGSLLADSSQAIKVPEPGIYILDIIDSVSAAPYHWEVFAVLRIKSLISKESEEVWKKASDEPTLF